MKHDGYDLVSTVLEYTVPVRPINTLSDETAKGAEETIKQYKDSETKDPTPEELNKDSKGQDKGHLAGDPEGIIAKVINKAEKK